MAVTLRVANKYIHAPLYSDLVLKPFDFICLAFSLLLSLLLPFIIHLMVDANQNQCNVNSNIHVLIIMKLTLQFDCPSAVRTRGFRNKLSR